MRIVLVMILLLIGCHKDNPNYCDGGNCGGPCTESNGTCVCLAKTCVECTADDERNCSGTTPQCGNDNRCRACRANDDCDSGACLEDGSCASPDEVIYASPSGVSTGGCGRMAGQNECSLAQALIEVAPPRDVIRLAAGSYTVPNVVDGLDFSTKSATVVARSATITRTGTGAILSVRNNQRLKLIGGTIQGPNNDDGLTCSLGGQLIVHETTIERMSQSGIETDACTLTVSRATIRNNLEGGIRMTAPRVATITNNLVYRNGGAGSLVGGMALMLEAGSKVEFNTVADNNAATGVATTAGGIACEAQAYDALFNLIYRNVGGLDGKVQVIGTCTFQGSFKQEAMSPTENVVGFERPDGTNPSYRLSEASPVGTIRDAFACANLIDFDGQARPAPAAPPVVMADKCDHGADEFYGR
jgi:hypothetical protein